MGRPEEELRKVAGRMISRSHLLATHAGSHSCATRSQTMAAAALEPNISAWMQD